MLKIDLITLHRVRNYGSSLQTLALQKKLEQMNCNVEVIDYYPERYTSLGLLKRLKNKSRKLKNNFILLFLARVAISPSYVKKKLVFDSFLKKNLHVTPRTYRKEQELLEQCPKADIYCTGSDQVWNSHWNEGIDAPFYLSFLPENALRFSYAASIGNSEIEDTEKEAILPYLKKYQFLSVREDSGVKILKDMGFDSACQVLDPTLLLKRDEWEEFVSDRYKDKKYVVTYNLHHDPEIDRYANTLAKEKGLEVYHISYNLHDIIRKGTLKWCPTVEEYLGLIKYAQYVVTDSFHATVFSLCFQKKFIAIYPQEAGSRISSLLHLVGLDQRGIHNWTTVAGMEEDIDYVEVDQRLETARAFSLDYLDGVLKYAREHSESDSVIRYNRLFSQKKDCCGCQACQNICPKNAISMMEDAYGFRYPQIDETLCVQCGACNRVCAFQHREEKNQPENVYAAVARDKKMLLDSASGGIFAALARLTLQNGGVVFGAKCEKDFTVRHVAVTGIEGLPLLQGSKYVQSAIGNTFQQAKEKLEEGRKVLFSGTPCQIAGLYSYLGKEYDNLYTVDIICHGVPANRVFQDFIIWLGKKLGGTVEEFRFRDKHNGWGLNGTATVNHDGECKQHKIYGSEYAYYYYFLHADLYRENCYACKYACSSRPGDLTIGDYWGIESAHPELLRRKEWREDQGISVVICNNEKGKRMVDNLKESVVLYPSNWEKAAKKNPQLRKPSAQSERRDSLLALYREGGYDAVESRYHSRMGWRIYSNRVKSWIPVGIKRQLKKIKK